MVQNFQKSLGLTADGIVGRNTARAIMEFYKIQNITQAAHFIGQMAHESGNFKIKRENMNYSAKRLIQVWPGRFKLPNGKPNQLALQMAFNPVALANYVYDDANRTKNYKLGNTQPGDGWRFRGNAALQLTGRWLHQGFSDYVKDLEIMINPDVVWQKYYIESAKWEFDKSNLWKYTGGISLKHTRELTKRIQGGYLDADKRYQITLKYYNLLK